MLMIREFRLEKGLTQEELATLISVKNYTIGNWERCRAEPSLDDLIKLANALNCTTDELLGRSQPEPSSQNSTLTGITPIEATLLREFRKLNYSDQNSIVGMVQAFVVTKR